MSRICRICLGESAEENYHARCLKGLFGAAIAPTIDLEASKLHTAAMAMVGRMSMSGIQKKISVNLSADRATLQVATPGGHYVLKPQTGTYPALPENEHLTMQLAKLADIDVPPNGLITLKDETFAYIVKRFDRLQNGRKLHQEDFCQLASIPPKEKYEGSAELCVRLLRRFAHEPLVEILKLYRQLVFAWWSGNGDMHLKNFSVLIDVEGIVGLSPAYDLLNTRLVIPDDPLALPVAGRKDNLNRDVWREFATYCKLPERVTARVLAKQASVLNEALKLIDRSFLPDDQKLAYAQLVSERTQALA